MYTLGFTKKYYTLWSVSVPQKTMIGLPPHIYQMAVTETYLKNLSMEYEEAVKKIEKISGGNWEEDLGLRGCTTRTRFVGPKLSDLENNQFTFGKLAGEKFEDVDDVWQLNRAMNEEIGGRRRALARKRLLELGELVKVGRGGYLTKKEIQAKRVQEEREKGWGHYFQEKDKVELELKWFNSFNFDTQYGTCFIDIFQDKEGKKFMYKGSNPPFYENKDSFVRMKGTIKHSEYNGTKQTLLQRIKVIS